MQKFGEGFEMTLANKLRLHIVLLIIGIGVLVWLSEKKLLQGGLIVLAIMGSIMILFAFGFYWGSQKCEKCGNYIYETAGDDWTKKPFTYLLIDGKCYGCEKHKNADNRLP